MNDVVTLREYLDQRLQDLESKLEVIERMNSIAVDKAVDTLNQRLESMNEFRAQMKDQQGTFATRTEFSLFMSKIDASIHSLEIDRATLEGKASQKGVTIAYIISAIGIIMGIIGIVR